MAKYYGLILPSVFPEGSLIKSIEQTQTSLEPGGENIITAELFNGKKSTFKVLNGSFGQKGDKGDPGTKIEAITADVDTHIGIPSVEVTQSGSEFLKSFNFSFKNLKGEKGTEGNEGIGIQSLEQVQESLESGGENILRSILTDGTVKDFKIRNGKKGDDGTYPPPITISETGEINAVNDKTFIINATSPITLTLGDGAYAGLELKLINTTDKTHTIHGTTARDGDSTLLPHQIQTIIWNGSKWEGLSCPRIGEIYVQYPQQEAPEDLFICTKWALQEQYAGAFFRATGGNAAAFINKSDVLIAQSEGLPNITGEIGFLGGGGNSDIPPVFSSNGAFKQEVLNWAPPKILMSDDSRTRTKVTVDASRSSPIYGRSDHVTPNNYTFNLWLRTA